LPIIFGRAPDHPTGPAPPQQDFSSAERNTKLTALQAATTSLNLPLQHRGNKMKLCKDCLQ
jgi:hypothetical protein